jgi:hypothetical protein
MDPRVRAGALWGLVGGLSFAVLALGYRIVTGASVGFPVVLLVAAAVAVVAGVASHYLDAYLAANGSA